METNNDTIYKFNISSKLGSSEYAGMFNDMMRFVTIQIAIQVMLVLMDSSKFSFFSTDFLILLLFVVIGVMFYWLVVKKIVIFL